MLRGKRVLGAGVLALALASGFGGAAHAATGGPSTPAPRAVPAGYEVVSVDFTNVPNGELRIACCPAGKVATGGGVDVGSSPTVANTTPFVENGMATGWQGAPRGDAAKMTVWVVCVS
ncbi:hypothetical protein [Streptomyces melanogenes]|uniref:hypothetical protein n=1 Tax=Streptomyces melanogenes TaxID=67326 RepID=UPI00167ECF08|nr:hypothetical protein [Streptomyces melanogenes]GGP89527.1 hypothetical protein GCM10010278_80030 [Streptomyces melanogenes]